MESASVTRMSSTTNAMATPSRRFPPRTAVTGDCVGSGVTMTTLRVDV
jgi:hypothetical protein